PALLEPSAEVPGIRLEDCPPPRQRTKVSDETDGNGAEEEPVEPDVESPVSEISDDETEKPSTLLLPAWPRSVSWVVSSGGSSRSRALLAIELPDEVRWQAASLSSSALAERGKQRTPGGWSGAAEGDGGEGPLPSPPADPSDALATPSSNSAPNAAASELKAGTAQTEAGRPPPPKRKIRLAGEWRSPVALELPPELEPWDAAKYTGVERTARAQARLLQLQAATAATAKPKAAAKAAAAAPPPAKNAALLQEPDAQSYTAKLVSLMSQLENPAAQPEQLVQSFWAQLFASERARFSAEFPQF
ncbi:unnamed protein product, partial [Polarella glacialis]